MSVRSSVALAIVLALAIPAAAQAQGGTDRLDMYRAVVSGEQLGNLLAQNVDVAAQTPVPGGVEVDLVLTRAERGKLAGQGIRARFIRVAGGLTVQQFAARQAVGGYNVWRPYDGAGGFADYMRSLARQNRDVLKLVVLGRTYQGRDILALKLTDDARDTRDGRRPAVLYSSTQHAREWIAGEVNRRLLAHLVSGWRAKDKATRKLLEKNELWFVLIANPDGYQYTFDVERLWRKNLRDNNGDGETQVGDGVDPNRNYPNHFNYDEEGSSSVASSDTYRGPAAASEPETQALKGLLDRIGFEFQVNYHSFGQWLLYAEGWQVSTATADDPIYYALSGNRDNPAIAEFVPGLSSDVLYVTNGETTDYAHASTGALAWTPELSPGCPDCGFVFPDDEALVQEEFERNLPFALDVARSAKDPDDPVSHLGITTKPFYLESDDTYKAGVPETDFTFEVSYGDPQPVQVLAKRALGKVTLKYRINGGRRRSARTAEWSGGERYGGQTDRWYRVMRGQVTGTRPGDSVEVWFEGGNRRSESFTYRAAVESANRVLVVAAEDYTGASPGQAPGPHYLQYYLDALAANGVAADVYDVDARGRRAPSHLGVLGHYDAAIWYTGDDAITREPGWGPGNMSRLGMDELLQFRSFRNEGGRVLYTGSFAGHQYAGGHGVQLYDPTAANAQCQVGTAILPRCLAAGGAGDGTNDTIQYWFGAFLVNEGAGNDPATGANFDATGVDNPFTGLAWSFGGADSADNQLHTASFISTSGILPPARYPQFTSWPAAKYDRPGGPFDPHDGSYYVYSQIADVSYKRLTRTIDVPAGGGRLSFWTSYDTEPRWDHLFVEAHTPGQQDWTTLPDVNGHTSQDTGDSCPAGWRDLHPQLDHYQTLNPDGSCSPAGTGGGQWNAASGNSAGWQEWSVDLGAWAGRQVEISIAYASDWSVQGLGTFVDDVTLPDGTHSSFETGLDGWAVTGSPPGSAANGNDFIRTTAGGFPEGAAIATEDSIYMGFGLEGIATAGSRAAVMGRAIDYLLR